MSSNCGCGSDCNDSDPKECPECGKEGKEVSLKTVINLLNKDKKEEITGEDYHLCMNPDCFISYYSDSKSFTVKEVRQPIWFKKGSTPKIACYCNNISYAEVESAIIEHDLKTWDEIVSGYRDKKICECEKFNPTGECCCSQNFYEVVNQVLESIGKEPVPPEDQCCG